MRKHGIVISSKHESNMLDTWSVYLLLVIHSNGTFEIGETQYEILGVNGDYLQEGGGSLLPEAIDGKKVFGVEGDYVFGGELSLEHTFSTLRFSKLIQEEMEDFLHSTGWNREHYATIEKSVKELLILRRT